MQAVWMVRSRQIARKLVWWLALIGFDPHDHTLSHRIYLVYASIFWSCWLFAMFSLFAGPVQFALEVLGTFSLNQAAAVLSALVLVGWGLYQLWEATRCSPFVFSEEDAHLVCQAPVSSSFVALAWFLGDWFEPAAPFWAGAVTLSIALVNIRLENKTTIADLPAYMAAGLQVLVLVALVQLGLMALVWAVGALRLQQDRQLTWQPAAVRPGIIALVLGLGYVLITNGLGGFSQPFWQAVISPIYLPMRAAFGSAPLLPGILLGLAWAVSGLAALAWAGRKLNLSRAAQETIHKELIETALRYGQSELASQVALSNRLGSGHSPSRLPARPGFWMLAWKNVLQFMRAFSLADAWSLLVLAAVFLGIPFLSDPGARGLALAILAVLIGQLVTSRLQKDLAQWSILRLLPFSSARLLLAELFLPWMLVALVGCFTLIFSSYAWLPFSRLVAALLLMCMSAAISFAMAYDLLCQAQSALLLNGIPPQVSSTGGFLSILCLVLPLGVWFGLERFNMNGGLPAVVFAGLLAFFFWHLSQRLLQRIE